MSDISSRVQEIRKYKKGVFRNECGGCFTPLHRNAKNKVGYICRKCAPSVRNHPNDAHSACHYCPFETDCTARVQFGLWIRCEVPDVADLERLRVSGGLYDENIMRELENALGKRGNRKVLEETVSKGAQKIYQSYITRRQRKVSEEI